MAGQDQWDEQRERARRMQARDQGRDSGHEFPARRYAGGGFAPTPHIGPTGMLSRSQAGDFGTSGRYYEDFDQRANYGGFEGGMPDYGQAESRSWARPAPSPMTQQSLRGRGPRGYQRSDERILEDVNDRLTEDHYLDATEIAVAVAASEVTLDGSVLSREDKRRAEDLADDVTGVRHVQNNLRVARRGVKDSGEIVTTFAGEPIPGSVADVTDGDR